MKKKLNYRFHNPNPADVAAEYILKVFMQVNIPKVEKAVRDAKMRRIAEENQKDRSALILKGLKNMGLWCIMSNRNNHQAGYFFLLKL